MNIVNVTCLFDEGQTHLEVMANMMFNSHVLTCVSHPDGLQFNVKVNYNFPSNFTFYTYVFRDFFSNEPYPTSVLNNDFNAGDFFMMITEETDANISSLFENGGVKSIASSSGYIFWCGYLLYDSVKGRNFFNPDMNEGVIGNNGFAIKASGTLRKDKLKYFNDNFKLL